MLLTTEPSLQPLSVILTLVWAFLLCISLAGYDVGPFQVLICHLYIFFGEPYRGFCPSYKFHYLLKDMSKFYWHRLYMSRNSILLLCRTPCMFSALSFKTQVWSFNNIQLKLFLPCFHTKLFIQMLNSLIYGKCSKGLISIGTILSKLVSIARAQWYWHGGTHL